MGKKGFSVKRILKKAGSLGVILTVLALGCSCSFKDSEDEIQSSAETEVLEETSSEETSEEETSPETVNEKPISLYVQDSDNSKYVKVSEVTDAWSDTQDLVSLIALVSDEEEVPYTEWLTAIKDSWNSVETETEYRVGYEISFDLNGENIIITILEPEDVEESEYLYNGDYPSDGDYSGITGYMGVWVYDDMAHEQGEWYSHVTSETKTDSTILSSIKLRPTPQSGEISNLVLRGFSYSSDEEFDENGNYAGAYAYTVTITNGE